MNGISRKHPNRAASSGLQEGPTILSNERNERNKVILRCSLFCFAQIRNTKMEENYEDMSNDQLRLKLLEYGFINMPVTSTTRKVLIKKLRHHISDSAAKVRRDTIHVTKYSSDEDTEPLATSSASKKLHTKKEPTNRRATIGGVSAKLPKPTSSQESSKVAAVTSMSTAGSSVPQLDAASKRRSGRVTPIKGKSNADVKATALPQRESALMEDSDDDMIPLTQLKQRDRKSKSPSLSRADMLTTSYIHQMEVNKGPPVEPIVEEMEIDLPEPVKEEQPIETIVLDDYDEIEQESMPPPRQPPILKPAVKDSVYSKTTTQFHSRRTLPAPERKVKDVSEPVSVRYGFAHESRPTPDITTAFSANVANSLREEGGSKYVPTDSPYLSEFTKRLSRLRAEAVPLPGSVGARNSPSRRATAIEEKGFVNTATSRSTYGSKDAYEASSSRFRAPNRYTYASFSPETVLSRSQSGDIRSSLRRSLLALDQKYSIRKKFYCVIVFLVVVFLFVFFFM
uniref:LEM domain-containing protein n=1 Tax=Anopheles atroparvus TaxID=41427 RepID=A0AAG5DBR5_ANOAO